MKDAGEDAGPGRPDSAPRAPLPPGAAAAKAGEPRTAINSLGRVPRIKPGSCAATVKPSGAAGPLCVAEAQRFPTPELPLPPPSAQPLRARRGRGTVTGGGLRASPAWGRGASTSKETPSSRCAHLPRSSPLRKTRPSPQIRETLPKPTPERGAPGPPRTQKPTQPGVSGRCPRGPQPGPSRAPVPSEPGRHPAWHPGRRDAASVCAPPSELILTRSSCVQNALRVPLGTISPRLRDLGGSHIRDRRTEARRARGGRART